MFNDRGERTAITTTSGPDRDYAVQAAEGLVSSFPSSTRVEISEIDNLAVYTPKPSKIRLERQPVSPVYPFNYGD